MTRYAKGGNGVTLATEPMLLRLGLATLLGGAVGLERGMQEQSAGLRTHAMVAVGATLFMMVSQYGFAGSGHVDFDPSRLAAQVVSGVGFLGAGAIIQQRQSVRGLTTAASIWAVAAIGLAVGGGLYIAAVSATALMLFILGLVKPVERRIFQNRRQRSPIVVLMDRHAGGPAGIEAAVRAASGGARLERIHIKPSKTPDLDQVELTLGGGAALPPAALCAFLDGLRALPRVHDITVAPPPLTETPRMRKTAPPTLESAA